MPDEDISARCAIIEECYEFMLAYAGQGLLGTEGSASTDQVRDFLRRAADVASGLVEAYAAGVKHEALNTDGRNAFLEVLSRDAHDTLATLELVLAQNIISSQLIDNLNASIHLRALLTDLFLVDEILKLQRIAANPAPIE